MCESDPYQQKIKLLSIAMPTRRHLRMSEGYQLRSCRVPASRLPHVRACLELVDNSVQFVDGGACT